VEWLTEMQYIGCVDTMQVSTETAAVWWRRRAALLITSAALRYLTITV